MKPNKRAIGTTYEKITGQYLEKNGYQVLEYNFRCKMGEIDIVAKDGDYLVFCEVKYRTDEALGHPLEAVDIRKQKIISKCAFYYITKHQIKDVPCRFDVIGILNEEMQLVQNAFEYVD